MPSYIISLLGDISAFIIIICLFFLLPVFAVHMLLVKRRMGDWIEYIAIALFSGFLLFLFVCLLARTFHLPFQVLWILPLASLFSLSRSYLRRQMNLSLLRLSQGNILTLLPLAIILMFSTLQSLELLPGGLQDAERVATVDTRDTLWNISIAQELVDTYPPQNFGFAGVPFKNNHFFYHLTLAGIHTLSNISILSLYYRLAPFFVSILFGLSLYLTIKMFTKSILFLSLGIFFGYFTGNLSYLLVPFKESTFNWANNTFFVDQPFDQLGNPYTVLGFGLFLFGGYVLERYVQKKNFFWLCLLILAFGLLYGVKAYGGIIAIMALFLTVGVLSFKKRNLSHFLPFVVTLPLFIFSFFTISELGKTRLQWAPGWILSEMMVGKDKVDMIDWFLKKNYFLQTKNILGLIKVYFLAFSIYLLGNLNVRILGLLSGLLKIKNFVRLPTPLFIFLSASFGIALFIPLLFNQGANAYNIIQFTPYALVAASVLMTPVLETMIVSASRQFGWLIASIILMILITVAVPSNIKELLHVIDFQNRKETLSSDYASIIDYLNEHTARDSVILVNPKEKAWLFIPALAQRRLYLLDEGFAIQTGEDPRERMRSVDEILSPSIFGLEEQRRSLESEKISHILLKGGIPKELFSKLLLLHFNRVYYNDNISIFARGNGL